MREGLIYNENIQMSRPNCRAKSTDAATLLSRSSRHRVKGQRVCVPDRKRKSGRTLSLGGAPKVAAASTAGTVPTKLRLFR